MTRRKFVELSTAALGPQSDFLAESLFRNTLMDQMDTNTFWPHILFIPPCTIFELTHQKCDARAVFSNSEFRFCFLLFLVSYFIVRRDTCQLL